MEQCLAAAALSPHKRTITIAGAERIKAHHNSYSGVCGTLIHAL